MKKMILIVLAISLVLGISFYIYRLSNPVDNGLYVPPVSQEAPATLKELLPYSEAGFKIVWNDATNQAEATISQPYPENSSKLVDWLADHNANNLPKNTLKIIKQ